MHSHFVWIFRAIILNLIMLHQNRFQQKQKKKTCLVFHDGVIQIAVFWVRPAQVDTVD